MQFLSLTIMTILAATYGVYGSEAAEDTEIHFRGLGDEIPCVGTPDCVGICSNYTSCGDDGICYCSDQTKEYEGVTTAAFSNTLLCKKQKNTSNSCFQRCNRRKGSVSTTTGAYTCTVAGIKRCWCDYRIVQDKFEPCKRNETCATIDKMMNVCKGSSYCLAAGVDRVISTPSDCLCAGGTDFSDSSSKNCQRDTFCFNTCNGVLFKNGLACSAMKMGKKTCFCSNIPRQKP